MQREVKAAAEAAATEERRQQLRQADGVAQGDGAEQNLSAYEVLRLKNMADNAAQIRAIYGADFSSRLHAQPKARPKPKPKPPTATAAPRSSTRRWQGLVTLLDDFELGFDLGHARALTLFQVTTHVTGIHSTHVTGIHSTHVTGIHSTHDDGALTLLQVIRGHGQGT